MLREAQHYLRYMDGTALPDMTAANKSLLSGMPLKTITRSTRDGRTITTTSEVVELPHGDLDASLFAVPADYKKMDMGKTMQAISPQMMDSVMTAQQEKAGSNCF